MIRKEIRLGAKPGKEMWNVRFDYREGG